ncbi:penicillin-binding protein activator [Thiobacter aerophilum]|uniref:Penicillin-binding protein activator n=1 Tax=Thiobacter aerophilum TaxID=3121275 RepID=A0ABV0EJA5_9BURK
MSLSENGPHIALLLPLNDPALRLPAEAVRQGFAAAAAVQNAPAWRVYLCGDEAETVAAYEQAVAAGARMVVGPLTRSAVVALVRSGKVSVPTLTLSLPEFKGLTLPPTLLLFGLSAEEEARQVADLAWRDGRREAVIVVADTPLAQRMQAAFRARWQALGARVAGQLRFIPGGEAALKGTVLQAGADMVFLATTAQEARAVRPYLPPLIPVYATSQAFGGRLQDPRNVDLTGVRFVDMPWLIEPDHPAVMIYPRPQPALNVELERLYALGIDAQRLASLLWQDGARPGATLDGVTGQLTIGEDQIVHRQGVPAGFQQDTVVVLELPTP